MNHYGVHVDPKVPTTGVFQQNNLEWINDELDGGIDPDVETAKAEWLAENPDNDTDDEQAFWEGYEQSECLIGFRLGEDGKYEPDPEAD